MSGIPNPGERWKHRRNKRTVFIVGVRTEGGAHEDWITKIDFRYVRGPGQAVGFNRAQTPMQTLTLADWQKFFTERSP